MPTDAAADGDGGGDGSQKVGSIVIRVLVIIMKIAVVLTALAMGGFYGFSIYLEASTGGEAVVLAKAMSILAKLMQVLLCVFIILAESGWERFLFEFGFMYTWPGRGIMQLFVAVNFIASKQEMRVSHLDEHIDADLQAMIVDILGFVMLIVGGLYLVMGVACMRGLNDSSVDQRARRKENEKRLHKRMTKKQWEEHKRKEEGRGDEEEGDESKGGKKEDKQGKKKDKEKDKKKKDDKEDDGDGNNDAANTRQEPDSPTADYQAMDDAADAGGKAKKKGGFFGRKK